MRILIIGSEGSMGKRYQAILKYLGKETICVDKKNSLSEIADLSKSAHGIILATPTDTHEEILSNIVHLRVPILCEKPITKNLKELTNILDRVKSLKTPFRMMMQYECLADQYASGDTSYDYFRHGADGLVWDCISIIGLAKKDIKLRQESPVWKCTLNGKKLNLKNMDAAYITYIQTWFSESSQSLSFLKEIHQKTDELNRSGLYV